MFMFAVRYRYVLSQTQVAQAVGKTEVSFRDFVMSKTPEALPYYGFRPAKLSVKGNNVKINTIPIDVTSAYWTKKAFVGNVTAARLQACLCCRINRTTCR